MAKNEIKTTETAEQSALVEYDNKVTQTLLLDYLMTMNKGLNETQKKQFLAVAGAFGLNPWKREVYAVTYKNKDGGVDMSIVTGYEVYLKRAELNPNYNGFSIEFKGGFKRANVQKNGKNGPYYVSALVPEGCVSCVCTVYRKDRTEPVRDEVFFDEYDKGNSMWQEKPRTMLKKCAIVAAFRKAFPIDFGGMPYIADEVEEASTNSEALAAQGYTEVKAEQKTLPLSDEKKEGFVKMLDEQAARLGNVAVDKVLEKYGTLPQIMEDRGVAVKVANELMNMEPETEKEVTEEDVPF